MSKSLKSRLTLAAAKALDPKNFGVEALHTDADGIERSYNVIYHTQGTAVAMGGGEVSSEQPVIIGAAADMSLIARGDAIEIDGVTWYALDDTTDAADITTWTISRDPVP